MSRKQGPRVAGMRPSARAEGSLRSSGEPAGLLLAGSADGRRHNRTRIYHRPVKEAEE